MEGKENRTTKTKIYNLIILDESGSMMSIYNQALSGANETIQTIRSAQASSDDQQQFLTFVTFDSGNRTPVRTIIDTLPIDQVKDLTEDDYRPNGCTPLYDAMGKSLTALEHKVKDGDQVLVTIITDGMENSSMEFSGAMICEIVKKLRAKGWTFVYIGANQDAVEVARQLNIENAMNFDTTHEDTQRMWKDYRDSTSSYYEKVRMSRMRGEIMFEDKEFFAGVEGVPQDRITSPRITSLQQGQIFVFGSNVNGFHGGGAAAIACRRFGAVYGNPVGPQGQCYAIPTVGNTVDDIRQHVEDFIDYASAHPQLTFLVTPIGCGIAGYSAQDIAPMFTRAKTVNNIHLPAEFWKYLR